MDPRQFASEMVQAGKQLGKADLTNTGGEKAKRCVFKEHKF